jgi:hypothetical protein
MKFPFVLFLVWGTLVEDMDADILKEAPSLYMQSVRNLALLRTIQCT